MKEQICRNCGNVMTMFKKCQICHNPIQFQCLECNIKTEEEIHLDCTPEKLFKKK